MSTRTVCVTLRSVSSRWFAPALAFAFVPMLGIGVPGMPIGGNVPGCAAPAPGGNEGAGGGADVREAPPLAALISSSSASPPDVVGGLMDRPLYGSEASRLPASSSGGGGMLAAGLGPPSRRRTSSTLMLGPATAPLRMPRFSRLATRISSSTLSESPPSRSEGT